MTGGEILYTIQSFFSGKDLKKSLTLDQFNYYYKMASNEFFRIKYKLYQETKENSDAMRIHISAPTSISLTTGTGALPSTYKHCDSIYYLSGTTKVPIQLVTNEEFNNRAGNSITQGTVDYPIATIYGSSITVSPSSISTIYMTFISYPTDPALALKLENGIMVYDSTTSVELDWDEQYHLDIVRLMLKYLGVSEPELAQFVSYSKVETAEQNQ